MVLLSSSSFLGGIINDIIHSGNGCRIDYLTGIPFDEALPGVRADWKIDAGVVKEYLNQL